MVLVDFIRVRLYASDQIWLCGRFVGANLKSDTVKEKLIIHFFTSEICLSRIYS